MYIYEERIRLNNRYKSQGIDLSSEDLEYWLSQFVASERADALGHSDFLPIHYPTIEELNSNTSKVIPDGFVPVSAPRSEMVSSSVAPTATSDMFAKEMPLNIRCDLDYESLQMLRDYDFDEKMGHIKGVYMVHPEDPALAIDEFLRYNRRVLQSLLRVRDSDKLIHVSNGYFIKGSADDLKNFRVFVDVDRKQILLTSEFNFVKHKNIFANDTCKVCPEFDYSIIKEFPPPIVTVTMTQSGPGCGKSFRLAQMVKSVKDNCLVLTCNKSMCDVLTKDLKQYGHVVVKTIDSYLMHHRTPATRVFFDELSLVHPGKILLATSISRCSYAHGFGDCMQISYYDRLNLVQFSYSDFKAYFPVIDQLDTSYRCPPDVCEILSPYYLSAGLKGFMSTQSRSSYVVSKSLYSFCRESSYNSSVLLVFCTEDKFLFSDARTINEFQGCQAETVVLYCSPASIRLQNSLPHVIVALSRHTRKLVVYNDATDSLLATLVTRLQHCAKSIPICGGAKHVLNEPYVLAWRNPDPYEPMTVARQSHMVIPMEWNRKLTCIVRPAKEYESPVLFSKHAELRVKYGHEYSYSELTSYFSGVSHLIRSRYVLLSAKAFPSIEPHLIIRIINRFKPLAVKLHAPDANVISNEVSEFAIVNELMPCFEPEPICTDRFAVNVDDINIEVQDLVDPVSEVQMFVDKFLTPDTSRFDSSVREFEVHTSDQAFTLDEVKYTTNLGEFYPDNFDKVRPVLATACPRTQKDTNVNAFHSVQKRNANVPSLSTVDDIVGVAASMVEKFMTLCPGIPTSSLDPGIDTIQAWINDQPVSVLSQMECDIPVSLSALDFYTFALKKSPKPEMTPNSIINYPAVQTILCQEKKFNAIFCAIFRSARDRVLSVLDNRILFFTKVEDSEFASLLTTRFPPLTSFGYEVAEFDMSKYDKSQGLLVLVFECMLLERLGLSRKFSRMWFLSHARCTARNMNTKFGFKTWYQRKSGDASTYFGNTLVLLMAILEIVPMSSIGMLLCSGDDSLLWTKSSVKNLNYSILATRFNFEVKLYQYNYHYFCSKFLVPYDNKWYIVPDPLKRAIKLGRHDLVNFEHVEEYRMSFKDNVQIYGNYSIACIVAEALKERYKCDYDATNAILAMHQLSHKDKFIDLFYVEPGDNLCLDPTRPVLEL